MPKSNLQRPDGLPVVRHPDDIFFRDDVILKNVSQPTIWGGIFVDHSIPYTKQRGLETGHPPGKRARFGTKCLAESPFQRKPMTPVQRRLASPEFMEMIDRPGAVAGGELIGRRQRAGEIGFCGAYGFAKLMALREIGRDRRG
jgi:hypothetical protein